jgi:hypothetical protein
MYPSSLIVFNCYATVFSNMHQRASRFLSSLQPIAAMAVRQRGTVALAARVLLPTTAGGTLFTKPQPSWRMFTGGLRSFSALKEEPVTQETLAAFSVADVKAWAAEIKGLLAEDVQKLVEQRVDGEQLLTMTKDELGKAGIPLGPAGKIMDAIERVKGSGTYSCTLPLPRVRLGAWLLTSFLVCPLACRYLLLLLDGFAGATCAADERVAAMGGV